MNFNINATALSITFTCPECDGEVYAYIDNIPTPNFENDCANGEYNTSEESFTCENCESEYTAEITVSINEGEIRIYDDNGNVIDESDIEIEELFNDDDE